MPQPIERNSTDYQSVPRTLYEKVNNTSTSQVGMVMLPNDTLHAPDLVTSMSIITVRTGMTGNSDFCSNPKAKLHFSTLPCDPLSTDTGKQCSGFGHM